MPLSPRTRLGLEALETRETPAASAWFQNGVLTVSGDSASDRIEVRDLRMPSGNLDRWISLGGGTTRVFVNGVQTNITIYTPAGQYWGRTSALSNSSYPTSHFNVWAGGGNDTVIVSTDLTSNFITTRIDGGDGDDFLQASYTRDTITGGNGHDTVYSGEGNDWVDGGSGDDFLQGGTGNDTLLGSAGWDQLIGADGNDHLDGGDHTDRMWGGMGDDYLFGGIGWWYDHLDGEPGNDRLDGGDGDDYLFGLSGNDTLNGGNGHDHLFGGTEDDTLYGGWGGDYLYGEDGNDWMDGNEEGDQLYGGNGHDTLRGGAGDVYDYLDGGDGVDYLAGGGGDDVLNGSSGQDTLEGEGGNDTLYGGTENDTLRGGEGNDGLFGGDGTNTLTGGSGADRFLIWTTGTNTVTVTDPAPEDATITFRNTVAQTVPLIGFGDVRFNAGTWTDQEIRDVDVALGNLHRLTNNTAFLERADGGAINFDRVGTQITVLPGGSIIGGWNGSGGSVIAFTQRSFNDWDATAGNGNDRWLLWQTIYHEIGHNWDDPAENGFIGAFRGISGWVQSATNPSPSWSPTQFTASTATGDDWWFNSGSQFARGYGQWNPFEDYATTWETYFMARFHGTTMGNTAVQAKYDNVISLINSRTT